MDLNQIFVEGRITKAPDIKICVDGETYCCQFSIACNRREKVNNAWESKPSYFFINSFLAKDDPLLNHLNKGDCVAIQGSMIQKENISSMTGKKYINWILQAQNVKKIQIYTKPQVTYNAALKEDNLKEIYSPKKTSENDLFSFNDITF
ncbi:MAG: hypothetical protein EOL97_02310 [Spirochaetia bacterium]|nr:hypothetical protein [Spirochaetia bacterium]